ncbi:hypothetical protein D9M71_787330 [compost metagenome]
MSNQAQADAIEHLLLAVLRLNKMSLPAFKAFEDAQASLMGSDCPGGDTQKTAAVEYLNHLKQQLK